MSGITFEELTPQELHDQWIDGLTGRFGSETGLHPNVLALTIILRALKWRGSARQIIDMLPTDSGAPDLDDLRGALARLGFKTYRIRGGTRKLTSRMYPCLLHDKNDKLHVVLGSSETTEQFWSVASPVKAGGKSAVVVADGSEAGSYLALPRLPAGDLYVVETVPRAQIRNGEDAGEWLHDRKVQFKALFRQTVLISFIINLLGLAVPISIMTIYDQVIGKDSLDTLYFVVSGVVAAFLFEISLRLVRARAQAYAGARLDFLLGARIFEQIVHLPASFTERAPVGGQITRIREFETFREFFSGALATVLLDLPFVLIFMAAIAWIAGPLVLIPVFLALLYIVLGAATTSGLTRRIRDAGRARSERHAFLSELTRWLRPIKQAGAEREWEERLRQSSADAAWIGQEVNRLQSGLQNLSQTMVMAAGVVTLSFGALRVIEEAMSLGALIATMILVWRVLQPIQTLFGLAGRIKQVQQSFQQMRRMMDFDREQEPGDAPSQKLVFRGELEFNRVSMRYSANANPALLGVSFKAEPGELVGIAGPSGAGKSTATSIAVGLMTPQAGSVLLDGIDIRQLRPITLRQTLAFVPQRNYAFPGTILDNLLLADPTADMDRVRKACAEAGILSKIEALHDGFDTRFRDGAQSKIPQSFLQQLALARALLRDAPMIIMDEPASALDAVDEAAFLNALDSLRGRKTILMVTQRPSHMRLCDKLVMMAEGQVTRAGTPEEVLGPARPAPQASEAGTNRPPKPDAQSAPKSGPKSNQDSNRQSGGLTLAPLPADPASNKKVI